jgi:hypothetical protein
MGIAWDENEMYEPTWTISCSEMPQHRSDNQRTEECYLLGRFLGRHLEIPDVTRTSSL